MNKEQCDILLGALADKIREQATTIMVRDFEINALKEKLAEAEKIIAENTTKEKTK